MNTRTQRAAGSRVGGGIHVDAAQLDVGLEALQLAPERVAPPRACPSNRGARGRAYQPRARAQHRNPPTPPRVCGAGEIPINSRSGSANPRARSPTSSWSTLPPGSRALRGRPGPPAPVPRARARQPAQHPPVRLEPALQGEHPHQRLAVGAGGTATSRVEPTTARVQLRALEADHSPGRARARPPPRARVLPVCRRLHDRRARAGGSSDLKIPSRRTRPRRRGPSISAASAGVANASGAEQHDRQTPVTSNFLDQLERRGQLLRGGRDLAVPERPQPADLALMRRMCLTASTMSPVPARPWSGSSPRPRRSAATPRRGSSRRTRNGTLNAHLSMWLASSAGVSTSDSST